MAIWTVIRRWVRRQSVAVFPLYITTVGDWYVVRCWLCNIALWTDNGVGDRSMVFTVADLTEAINRHAGTCEGWQ